VKAYCADQAFRIAEMAIQTYGGAGYVTDNPVEQYCRDAKIFSIYEGTNHIQAIDLIPRKLQHGGENFAAFLYEINEFVTSHSEKPGMEPRSGSERPRRPCNAPPDHLHGVLHGRQDRSGRRWWRTPSSR
jgi:hypothetical protein